MKNKTLYKNTVLSLFLKIVTILCGFVLPRLILSHYGSTVNGLVSSISQFLALITFLDFGVGSVIQSSFYKPLAEKNLDKINSILIYAQKYYNKIGFCLLLYTIILCAYFPYISKNNFEALYVITLVIAISISLFAQYFFGIVNSLLLNADQKGYIDYFLQIISLVCNTFICYFLIKYDYSIQFVKLISSIIFLVRPVLLLVYVKHNYKISSNVKICNIELKQKWNGLAQHFMVVILYNSPVIILTIFSSMAVVSVFSVYSMIVREWKVWLYLCSLV